MTCESSPAKRPRTNDNTPNRIPTNPPLTVVSSIHQAVTSSQRFESLKNLFCLLKYDYKGRSCNCTAQQFMDLIEAGVVNALCLQLGFLLNRHGTSPEEIDVICTAIDVFYRFCPDLVSERSLKVRGKEIMRLLSEVLKHGVTLPVISIWHSYSSNKFGTCIMLENPTFVPIITDVFRRGIQDEETLAEILGLLKNITHYDEKVRTLIVEQHELLSALTRLSSVELSEKSRERLSGTIRNLAMSSETRALLARRADVLTCILRLASKPTQQTLRNLFNALVNLTMDTDSSLLISLHGDGMIIDFLRRHLVYESDSVIRKRAARVIRLMAGDSTFPFLIHDKDIMNVLSDIAVQDPNYEVRSEAAEAFGRCASLIKAAEDQHGAVLDALTKLARSSQVPPDVLTRAVKEQTNQPENRSALMKRSDLIDMLAQKACHHETSTIARDNICHAFLNLSQDAACIGLLASASTLHAIVSNTMRRGSTPSIQEAAVKTLLNLASEPKNRKLMARHPQLIQALMQFAGSTAQSSFKDDTKSVILSLAAEL